MSMVGSADFNRRLLDQVQLIRTAEDEYRQAIATWAEAERLYKLGQAVAYVHVTGAKNAGERDARAEEMDLHALRGSFDPGTTINGLRHAAHLAENMMNAGKLAVQNRAAELSALQSEANLAKEEARFIRSAPHEVVGA